MATTVANVPVGGRPYTIVGPNKVTVSDVTIADNSEVITAAQLGLNCIYNADAQIRTGQTSDTGVYAKCTPVTGDISTTLALFAADGTAATTSATTVVRVTASGY
jgi:hypothetical protein